MAAAPSTVEFRILKGGGGQGKNQDHSCALQESRLGALQGSPQKNPTGDHPGE